MDIMSEMIERVAKAMAWADLNEIDRAQLKLDGLSQKNIVIDDHMKSLARAAIEAMREPTKKMSEATYLRPYDADEIWEFMIDAALKD